MKHGKNAFAAVLCGITLLSLSACGNSDRDKGAISSQSGSDGQISSIASCFTDDELHLASEQLPILIDTLLSTSFREEPIEDAATIPMVDIWRFVTTIPFSAEENNPYDFLERRKKTIIADDGMEFEQSYSFISLKNAKRIAREFFGVDDFFFAEYYDEDWDGYSIPDGIGSPYEFSYKDLQIDVKSNGDIRAALTLLPASGYGETSTEYGKYILKFKLIQDDGLFIRFQSSERE